MQENIINSPIEKQEEKNETKNISSLLNDVKKIYESWKEADKTYNKDKITNQKIREKFIFFKEKWENINNDYSDIIKISSEKINNLKKEVEDIKKENIKYESIITISSIYFFLEKENKDKKLDAILKKYNITDNIKDLTKDPEKIEELLQILKNKS
jgi:DNA repair exonuclease SbcCD ATPase subunit